MNEQQRNEIIKALAWNIPADCIAEEEGYSVSDVEQIAYDYADAVAAEKEYNLRKRGCDNYGR